MQQEKWRLEERVLHLEETNAAMADEMVKRGKLIQHYCMEGRSSPAKPGMNSISLNMIVVKRFLYIFREFVHFAQSW
jgi:hypothetical protein